MGADGFSRWGGVVFISEWVSPQVRSEMHFLCFPCFPYVSYGFPCLSFVVSCFQCFLMLSYGFLCSPLVFLSVFLYTLAGGGADRTQSRFGG